MGLNFQRTLLDMSQLGGAASILANAVKQKLNTKVRGIEFSLLQRCASHIGSNRRKRSIYGRKWLLDIWKENCYMVGFERRRQCV